MGFVGYRLKKDSNKHKKLNKNFKMVTSIKKFGSIYIISLVEVADNIYIYISL